MNKLLMTSMLTAGLAITSQAMATGTANLNAGGSIPQQSTFDATNLGDLNNLDLADQTAQSMGNYTAFSNIAGGYKVAVTTSYELTNATTGDAIPFSLQVSQEGSTVPLLGLPLTCDSNSANCEVLTNVNVDSDVASRTGNISLLLGETRDPSTTVSDGSYTAAITVEMSAQ